jgi:hypothetical protein
MNSAPGLAMVSQKNRFWSRFVTLLGAVVVLAMSCAPIPAQAAEDVFTVSGVKVDVTAENAVAAREKAFSEAQETAFKALALRILGEEVAKTYPVPSVASISTMIKDFEITDERLSAVEYIATYTFRFDGNSVRAQFNMENTPYNAASRPVLVLPFYQMGSRITLWQDSNPHLGAWSRSNAQGGLLQIRVPLGDIRDIADVGDDQALTYRRDGLYQILERYNTSEAIVLIAVPGPADAADVPTDISTMIYRTDRDRPEYVQTVKTMPDENSTTAQLYDKAVREVRAALQRDWKSEAAGSYAYTATPHAQQDGAMPHAIAGNVMTVRAQFSTMQQWIETRQAIRRVPGLVGMKVRSVTPREAVVELEYTGDELTMKSALTQQDLVLSAPEVEYAYGSSVIYGLALKKYAPF